MTFDLDLDLEHTLDAGLPGYHYVQVWSRSSLGEEAIFVPAQKCPYHVTFDFDLDLEHTVDAGLPGVHRVQVWWRSDHLPARSDGQGKFSTLCT